MSKSTNIANVDTEPPGGKRSPCVNTDVAVEAEEPKSLHERRTETLPNGINTPAHEGTEHSGEGTYVAEALDAKFPGARHAHTRQRETSHDREDSIKKRQNSQCSPKAVTNKILA
ncbi:hypothetical protein R1flu_005217 [Riccia fluitans]|uniref:Uncharacterized protein n=1 Tax=Riccia fluitans TaxID=41844 RepID=A0ABD1YSJ6_9MARC